MRCTNLGAPAAPVRHACVLMIWLLDLVTPRPAGAAPCTTAGETAARIMAVEARLELRLEDGRLIRLVGLDPPSQTPDDPDLAETARLRLATMFEGKAVTLHLLAGTPDRWGRIAALVFPADQAGTPGGVASIGVAAGLGRYLAEPTARACRDALLAAEGNARRSKLGLWTDPYYAVLAVDDRAAFTERSGTIVLAEGRLTAVEPGPYRTTLRFAVPQDHRSGENRSGDNRSGRGSYGGHMLVATILPHAMKIFEAQQVDVRALIGQQVRFRGLLDLRFGPRIELTSPDQIEPTALPRDAQTPAGAPPRSN